MTTIIAMDRKGRVLEVRIQDQLPVPRTLPEPYRVELSLGSDPP